MAVRSQKVAWLELSFHSIVRLDLLINYVTNDYNNEDERNFAIPNNMKHFVILMSTSEHLTQDLSEPRVQRAGHPIYALQFPQSSC